MEWVFHILKITENEKGWQQTYPLVTPFVSVKHFVVSSQPSSSLALFLRIYQFSETSGTLLKPHRGH